MSAWISVSERLPDDCVDVLAYFGDHVAQDVCHWNAEASISPDTLPGCWIDAFTLNEIDFDPTHWMPLPEPPKS